ncbi:MAG: glutamate-5-semialdehyde dehydrogenase [Ruminococcaceae bacterium]|nr:glutamate-5-semialdehyde dehydrogenase [Oscillospiraceae bacterium]
MLTQIGINAKKAERVLMTAPRELRDRALKEIAASLRREADFIITENAEDIFAAKANGMSESMLDRLSLDKGRIEDIATAAENIVSLPDPLGRVLSGEVRPNGMKIEKVTVPIGVIAIIFEARPNVTVDAAALCLKSGNTVILRGGKEAINSNKAMVRVMREALARVGLPADCIQLVEDTTRDSATALMKMNSYVDVLIPRGGAGLIRACVENSTVPVIETGTGNCHIYVDKDADLKKAVSIVYNAKTSRPSVCNACESLVIHEEIAEKALPLIKKALDEKSVTVHGDERCASIITDVVPATYEDYAKEYLGYEISVKVVSDIESAVEHIMEFSSGHSECIITENYTAANYFTSSVDAAAVYVNASTRFTDGGEFGFGAEIGISTQKLHARGPLGLPELTTVKYVITGDGQVR